MKRLPVVKYENDGEYYYFDARLKQLRNVYNPFDYIDLNEFELHYYEEKIKVGEVVG